MVRKLEDTGLDFDIWQIDHDINGNARYVVHYSVIPFKEYTGSSLDEFISHQSAETNNSKRALNGQKYRAKWYGGGIVFQAYAGDPVKHVRAAILASETGIEFLAAYKSLDTVSA